MSTPEFVATLGSRAGGLVTGDFLLTSEVGGRLVGLSPQPVGPC